MLVSTLLRWRAYFVQIYDNVSLAEHVRHEGTLVVLFWRTYVGTYHVCKRGTVYIRLHSSILQRNLSFDLIYNIETILT